MLILAHMLLLIRNGYKSLIVSLLKIANQNFLSDALEWDSIRSFEDVFSYPDNCAKQIHILNALQSCEPVTVEYFQGANKDDASTDEILRSESHQSADQAEIESFLKMDMARVLLNVAKTIIGDSEACLDSLEHLSSIYATTESVFEDEDESDSMEMMDCFDDQDELNQPKTDSGSTNADKYIIVNAVEHLRTMIDNFLLIFTLLSNVFFVNNGNIEQEFMLENINQSLIWIQRIVLRILGLLKRLPATFLAELNNRHYRLSQLICVILMRISSTLFDNTYASIPYFASEKFIDAIIVMSRIPFAKTQIDSKVAVTGMALFVKHAALPTPQVVIFHIFSVGLSL